MPVSPDRAVRVVNDLRRCVTRADPEWREDFFATISPAGAEGLWMKVELPNGRIRDVVLACHPEHVPDEPPDPALFG